MAAAAVGSYEQLSEKFAGRSLVFKRHMKNWLDSEDAMVAAFFHTQHTGPRHEMLSLLRTVTFKRREYAIVLRRHMNATFEWSPDEQIKEEECFGGILEDHVHSESEYYRPQCAKLGLTKVETRWVFHYKKKFWGAGPNSKTDWVFNEEYDEDSDVVHDYETDDDAAGA